MVGVINTHVSASYATHVPEVSGERVADGIYSERDGVVEIGLFALDFQGVRTSEDESIFVGRIANFGDLRVEGIRATIWLVGDDGRTVDGVPITLHSPVLEPGEVMTVQATHTRGQNPPRLLSESVYFGRDGTTMWQSLYGQDVVFDPSLDWIPRVVPWATYEPVWTTPAEPWRSWIVDVTCNGEPF